jgi:hypothetical protein
MWLLQEIFKIFIRYNNRLQREGSAYINRDSGRYRDDIKYICQLINTLNYNNRRVDITNEEITMSLGQPVCGTHLFSD